MPVPSSACLVESSRSTLFFLLFPFGRYGGPVGAPRFKSGRIHVPGAHGDYRGVFLQVELHAAPPPSQKEKFLAAATSKPNRRLSGFHERFRQVGCLSATMR